MQGYLGRDDLTAAAFRDGWYVTGDQGFLSEDGFLKITGRLSRFSKIGGEMVPHGLIEEVAPAGRRGRRAGLRRHGRRRRAQGGKAGRPAHARRAGRSTRPLKASGSLGLPNLFIPRRENFIKVDQLPMLGHRQARLASDAPGCGRGPRSQGGRDVLTAGTENVSDHDRQRLWTGCLPAR